MLFGNSRIKVEFYIIQDISEKCAENNLLLYIFTGGSKVGCLSHAFPGVISVIWMQFLEKKIGQIVRWYHHLWNWLPRLWNPGSATATFQLANYLHQDVHFRELNTTSNNRKTGVSVVVLMDSFETSSIKCWTTIFVSVLVKVQSSSWISQNLFTILHSKIHIHTPFTPVSDNC